MKHRDNHILIDLRHVVKTYETGAGSVTVLKDITLRVQEGEFVSVVGPSGSGKSTLLNMITGIDRPTSGEVFVGGQALHTLSEDQLARWRGRHIGVVFQFFHQRHKFSSYLCIYLDIVLRYLGNFSDFEFDAPFLESLLDSFKVFWLACNLVIISRGFHILGAQVKDDFQ